MRATIARMLGWSVELAAAVLLRAKYSLSALLTTDAGARQLDEPRAQRLGVNAEIVAVLEIGADKVRQRALHA